MNRKDVCPCCGHMLPPLRVRVAYGGMPDCPHCGSNCGLPPKPLLGEDYVFARWARRWWMLGALLIWVTAIGTAVWMAVTWTRPG